jgi:hypothetical protein
MTIAMQPIYTQTVGAGSPGSIVFNNIPQTFTDLKLVISTRDAATGSYNINYLRFNGEATGTNYSSTAVYATASTTASSRDSSVSYIGNYWTVSNGATENTFNSMETYIPNYTSSNFKSGTIDSVTESNSTSNYVPSLTALLWRNTAAITSITIIGAGFLANSTFSLYGITKG